MKKYFSSLVGVATIGLLLLCFAGYWFYKSRLGGDAAAQAQSLASGQSKADSINAEKNGADCQASANKSWAYKVDASVVTTLSSADGLSAEQTSSQVSSAGQIYKAHANFTLDFTEQSQQIRGLASGIGLSEIVQGRRKSGAQLPDVTFLAYNQSPQYAQFGFFDDLGLPANHPMKLLNPLVKQLSVADAGSRVVYPYDPLGVGYEYTHTFPQVTRLADGKAGNWQVSLSDDCLVDSLHAVEVLPFKLGTTQATMRYEFAAKRVPSTHALTALDFQASANAKHIWQNAVVDDVQAGQPIQDDASLWQAVEQFSHNKNTGQLKKAGEYLVKTHSPKQLADLLMGAGGGTALTESAKRELIFSLSLSDGAQVPDYILDTLSALPVITDAQGDVQKVRLMVALTGRDDVGADGFNRLMALRSGSQASDNVKNNALISGAKLAKDLVQQGQMQPMNGLEAEVRRALSRYDDNAASAILAAGNASLTTVNNELINQLNKGTDKSRYAAASVLVKDEQQYQVLIDHLAQESSPIVSHAIISGLDGAKLTANQRAVLSKIKQQLR